MPEPSKDSTRRELMKMAGSVTVVAGMSGCQGLGSGDGGDGSGDGSGDGGDGQIEGEPISIDWQNLSESTHPSEFQAGRIAADTLSELGIDIEFRQVETGAILENLGQKNYDMMMMGFGPNAARLDPQTFLSWYTEGHSQNYWSWSHPDFEEVMEEQSRELDQDRRQELIYEAQDIWAEHQPGNYMFRQQRTHVMGDKFPNPTTFPGLCLNNFWNLVYAEPAENADDAVMRVASHDPIQDINPVSAVGGMSKNAFLRQVYDRLYRVTPEAVPELWAAENVEFVDDTTIQVSIHDGMTWHDGEDLTADDVKFSFEYQAANEGFFRSNADVFESITVDSETDLTFNLNEPNATVLSLTFGQVFLIPEHIWADVDNPLEFQNEEVVGSGPLMLDSRTPGQTTEMVRFDDHFDPASIDRMIFTPFENRAGAVRAVEAGEADLYVGLSPTVDTIDRLQGQDGIQVITVDDYGIWVLLHHNDQEPYSDVAFRKALSQAMPKQRIIDIVFDGRAIELNSPITKANPFWHNPDVPKYGNDVEAGRQTLRDAGYRYDDEGNLYPPA